MVFGKLDPHTGVIMPNMLNSYLGCLLGLAAGDAVGTTLEFRPPGTFQPITDMVGGGPFNLEPGQWTDDTSMALCLGQSLIDRDGFDPEDQMNAYAKWARDGYMSSNGRCFDIGGTVSEALCSYSFGDTPFAGPTSPNRAGNGSIMRLAPVPMLYARDIELACWYAQMMSCTTHGADTCVDACHLMTTLIVTALNGGDLGELPPFSRPYCAEIQEIADGSFREKQPPEIKGTGYVVKSLEAALWAFHNSANFAEGALLAANLGDDADTTAAIYGQIAGAVYGVDGIPQHWLDKLAEFALIESMATTLYERAGALDIEAHRRRYDEIAAR
jgi:ADP-ribosylglycohydrolase